MLTTTSDDHQITRTRVRFRNGELATEWKLSYLDGLADETDIDSIVTSRGECFRGLRVLSTKRQCARAVVYE